MKQTPRSRYFWRDYPEQKEIVMYVNLWMFLTITIISSALFVMLLVYTNHRKTMKELEIEALKIKNSSLQANAANSGSDKPVVDASQTLDADDKAEAHLTNSERN